MTDLNPTTRTYSRGLPTPAIEGPYKPEPKTSPQTEFWVYITLAFAAGFVTHLLWGAR
jgi:hypothetical protein